MSGQLSVVVGGQYGSEGKGAVAGWLSANSTQPVSGVRVAGPNAGHTVYGNGPDGEIDNYAWKLRTVPVTAVTAPQSRLVIAAGSEIEQAVLEDELDRLDRAGYNATQRLIIDDQATLLEPKHQAVERKNKLTDKLGSTAKGIGAARAARIMRDADLWGGGEDTVSQLHRDLDNGWHVIIEGTQGYGLGLHAGLYPYCTSSDCRAIDFCAMAGISPWYSNIEKFDVWVVLRTFPIRVAGNSGPMIGEKTWDQVGQPEERTTVTNKVRRVGDFDFDLAYEAVQANGGAPVVKIALTMFDYVFPQYSGQTEIELDPGAEGYIRRIQDYVGAPITLVGTSPTTMAKVNVK